MNKKTANSKEENKSCVEVLRDLIDKAGHAKLIVALAFFLGKSTTTIYAWGRIGSESKALEELTHVGSLVLTEDSQKELVEIVMAARLAVQGAMKGG